MDFETPLMTAASYGDLEVAQVLIGAGADLHAIASVTHGAVPGGTALQHATVFGMTAVADVLMKAGAPDIDQAAAAGDVTSTLTLDTPEPDRIAALRIAAEHGQLRRDRPAARRLDARGRSRTRWVHRAARGGVLRPPRQRPTPPHPRRRPNRRDTRFDNTPLDWCRHQREEVGPGHGHDEVEQILRPITLDQP